MVWLFCGSVDSRFRGNDEKNRGNDEKNRRHDGWGQRAGLAWG
jgi:hypothetical protein